MSTISYPAFLNFSIESLKFSIITGSTPFSNKCQGTPIFLEFSFLFLTEAKSRSSCDTEVLSSASCLDNALKIISASRTVLPNGETWSSELPMAIIPCLESAPYVGLRPTSPQNAAGSRTEPHVSVPRATSAISAATAAAEPPEEPPGTRVGSRGLRVTP